jgi:hypothetical protein
VNSIKREIRGAADLCTSCGKEGHFANTCFKKPIKHVPAKNSACFRCGREGHYANNCYARTDVDGDLLDSENDWDTSDDEW